MAITQGFIIALLLGIVACYYNECPPYGTRPGCSCMFVAGRRVVMVCRGKESGKNIEDFRSMLEDNKLQSKALELTFITKNDSKLSSRIFEGFNVKSLTFRFSRISSWADEEGGPAFVGLEHNLESLHIDGSINIVGRDKKAVMTLGHLRKLRTVQFHENKIYDFGNDWFGEGGKSVEELELDKASLYTIGDRAFASLTNLVKIQIHGNDFGAVTRSMFPNPATHLREFLIWNNKLRSLPEDIFTNMPALTSVDFSHNYLTQLPESIWRPVWSKVRSLNLRENRLECEDDSIKWIFKERIPMFLYGSCYSRQNSTYVQLKDLILENQSEEY